MWRRWPERRFTAADAHTIDLTPRFHGPDVRARRLARGLDRDHRCRTDRWQWQRLTTDGRRQSWSLPADRRVATAGTGQSGATWVFSFKPLATYSPAQQGAITSIDFAVDGIQFVQADTSGGSVALALQQGGTRYYAPHPQSPGGQLAVPERSWTPKARSGLVQSDFRDNDLTGRPLDFSASGASITLGFVYWVSTPIDGGLSARTAGFDNWTVTVRR
jgi:hypothetical protein